MAITVKCTQCGNLVAAPDSAAGKKGRCTLCGEIMDIPAPAAIEPAPVPGVRVVEPDDFALQETAGQSVEEPAAVQSRNVPKNSLDQLLQSAPTKPARSKMSCGVIALILIGIFSVMLLGGGTVAYFALWPAFSRARDAAREATAIATIRHLAMSEQIYLNQSGEFAARISGANSLSSANLVSPLEAAAEAPPGPAQPYAGFCYRILTSQGGAPGNIATSFVDAQGRMTGGFAILAYQPGSEGLVHAYICARDGIVYTKTFDLDSGQGPASIQSYDTQGWQQIASPFSQPPAPKKVR